MMDRAIRPPKLLGNFRIIIQICDFYGTQLTEGAARRSWQDATESPWVGFVDADIVILPNWLRRCLEELSDVDGVSGIAQPDGDCTVIWRICQPTLRHRPGSAAITGNNVLFSREALTRVPFSRTQNLVRIFA